jgi:phytoene desaturase
MERLTGESLLPHVIFRKSYGLDDFSSDYNAFKGNAYGLANTLMQTANLKPRMVSKKVSNLFFAGQLTVPGPGVPPSIISGQIAADEIVKRFRRQPNN